MATAATPSYEQAMAAKAIADQVRIANARYLANLKQQPMRRGLMQAAALLRDGDMKGPAGAIQVYRLVTSIRYVQRKRAEAILYKAQVYQSNRSLRKLSPRQRELLATLLTKAAVYSRERLPVDQRAAEAAA
jgi:hypothetical protein